MRGVAPCSPFRSPKPLEKGWSGGQGLVSHLLGRPLLPEVMGRGWGEETEAPGSLHLANSCLNALCRVTSHIKPSLAASHRTWFPQQLARISITTLSPCCVIRY